MSIRKILKLTFPIVLISSLLMGCFFTDTDLKEIKGVGLTSSEYFKAYDGLDERGKVKYYKPFPMDEVKSFLPEQIKKAVHPIDSDRLPFTVNDEKAYLITSKGKNGKIKNQVQLSYFSKSEYDKVDDFFIISVTEVEENPLEKYDISDEYDSVGNKLKKEILTEELPIYQQVITTNSALLYTYYDYDESKNRIFTIGTAANEFYAYYEGYIFHIGYLIDREKNNEEMQDKMLQLTREYILGNSL